MNFIVRWLITALAVAFTVWLVPGIGFVTAGNSVIDVVAFAIVLALLNMAVKPILQALSLPITVLTFGLFYLVVNTAMLYLASGISGGLFGVDFYIASSRAFIASIVTTHKFDFELHHRIGARRKRPPRKATPIPHAPSLQTKKEPFGSFFDARRSYSSSLLTQENMSRIFAPVFSISWLLMASRCSKSHLWPFLQSATIPWRTRRSGCE